jgi:hypothetical protein
MVEDEEGEATMACKMPSSSACKAFNQEDEEDEFDRLACESLQRLRCRPKPALKTQVCTEMHNFECLIGLQLCQLYMLCKSCLAEHISAPYRVTLVTVHL